MSPKNLRNLGFLGIEIRAEVAPFVCQAIQFPCPLFAFLMESIPTGVILVDGRVGKFHIPAFYFGFELGDVLFKSGDLFLESRNTF